MVAKKKVVYFRAKVGKKRVVVKAKVLKVMNRQTGAKKISKLDMARSAMPPGKRLSRTGKVYYVYGRTHTDMPGKKY